MLFIGFTTPFAKLITFILPDRKENDGKILPLLDSYYLTHVGLALDMVRNALFTMGSKVMFIINDALQIAISGNEHQLHALRERDKLIDNEHAQILQFLQNLQQNELAVSEANTLRNQIEAANILETIADLITTDLVEAADHRIENGFIVSPHTEKILSDLYNKSVVAFGEALSVLQKPDNTHLSINGKTEFKDNLTVARNHLVSRLSGSDEHRIEIFRFESEVLEVTRRLHSLARRLIRKDI